MSPLPHVAGVRHRYVEVDGVRFHVAEAGVGEPLLLLHGWPQNWYMWRKLVPPLARRYRMIMPDLRGFGWSEAPAGGYGKERFAGDMLGVLDQLGVERCYLMGHDWGGFISYLIALRAPSRVKRLMPLNIIHPWPSPLALALNFPRSIYALRNAFGLGAGELRNHPQRFAEYMRSALGRTDAITDDDMRIYLGPLALPGRAHVTTLVYRDFMTREVFSLGLGRYHSQRLTVPTLSLFGINDRAIHSRILKGYEKYADNMSIETVPNCGHFIVDEQPDLVADRALRFFVD